MSTRTIREVENYSYTPLRKNVAIYCRVSTGLQSQLHSMSTQASSLVRRISRKPYYRLVDIYLDFKSGKSQTTRNEFLRMLSDAKEKKFDVVFTKNIPRLGRNTEEFLTAIRELKDLGIAVIFDFGDENNEKLIDTSTMDSELLITILSAYAESENTSRHENQEWAIKKRLEDGTSKLYTKICYGYKKDLNGNLITNPDEASVVTNIFNWYLSGYSVLGIIKELQKQQTPSPNGKEKWCKRSIKTILTNDKYIGTATVYKSFTKNNKRIQNNGEHQKYQITDNHPAIIPATLFQQVAEIKQKRSNVEKTAEGTQRKSNKYSSKKF